MSQLLPVEPQYLRVRNWHKFQHYPDRRPIWIKNYVDLDDASSPFSKLSFADQGRLQRMWRLAAKLNNTIPYDRKSLARAMGMKEEAVWLTVGVWLSDNWLQVGTQKELKRWASAEKRAAKPRLPASKPLAKPEQDAIPEQKSREEKKDPAVEPADFRFSYELKQLLETVGRDADSGTPVVLRAYIEKNRIPESVLVEARTAAGRPSCRNRAKVAMGVMQSFVAERAA